MRTEPIRQKESIEELKRYFLVQGELRNYLLVTMGLNVALRISDILRLQWKDVYDFRRKRYKQHIVIVEMKTGKDTVIALNDNVIEALELFRSSLEDVYDELFIFKSRVGENRPISRNRAYHIIKDASIELGFEENIACHSLRKTFGYQAWKQGVHPVLLMSIYNHSSYEVTKHYLGINQDERDRVFLENML